jgi:hypothetical protein
VPAVLAAATGSDWSSGGALFTFYFPVALFVVVAVSLYVNLTRPHAVPARKPLTAAGTLAVPERQGATAADPDHEAPNAGT